MLQRLIIEGIDGNLLERDKMRMTQFGIVLKHSPENPSYEEEYNSIFSIRE